MVEEEHTLSKYVLDLLESGKTREEIETHLLDNEHDEKFVKEIVREAAEQRYLKKRSQGLTLIFAGAFICFLSFLLTITSSFTHGSFPWVLYGLTSVGIIIVFTGFTKIF